MKPDPAETEVMPDERALTLRPAAQAVAEAMPPEQIKPPITAAQAKIDAVAHLTMAAYERAATLDLTPEESAALQADFPDEAFQPGAAGKESLIYIEHAALRQRFNQVFGMGKWAIVPRNRWGEPFRSSKGVDGERIYVEAMLIVRGCFVGEAVGAMEYYPKNASQNYGDAVEGAKTAAFRRCAKEFGVGLQAWSKAWCDGWWQRKRGAVKFAPAPRQEAPAPKPAAPPAPPKVVATEKTRDWMIAGLLAKEGQPNRQQVTDYFRRIGALIPTEEVEDLPLKFVPTSKAALAELADAISGLGPEQPAEVPVEPSSEPENEPEAPADDRPHVTGKIERVTVKEGQSKKGAWKLYGICIKGEWANTFDVKLGEQAQGLQGQEVTVYYTENERGKTVEEITTNNDIAP